MGDNMNFEKLRQLGVTPTLFAEAFGYSRPTCSRWFTGKKAPHFLHEDKVRGIVDALIDAGTFEILPMPDNLTHSEKVEILRDIVNTTR